MSNFYVEYQIDDGTKLLVELTEPSGGTIKASREDDYHVIESKLKFRAAFSGIKNSMKALLEELSALKTEEAEVKFGLKTVGEAGIFVVGKVGAEVNYEVTLKWKKPSL